MTEPLRIATWNLEHLSANGDEGCISRTAEDFEIIKRSIDLQDFDVVAFQEVKDQTAAEMVFPTTDWNIEMSSRPHQKSTRECMEAPGRLIQHLGTGFAVKKGIEYDRNKDSRTLNLNNPFERWGTDISIRAKTNLRLLNVHLTSGCWGSDQDKDDEKRSKCVNLKKQFDILSKWRDARIESEESFVILGDFNRRLAVPDDWGWNMLNTSNQSLQLLTSAGGSRCHPIYPEFIDHIIVGDLTQSLHVGDSFLEGPRVADHPDHCAVSAEFNL